MSGTAGALDKLRPRDREMIVARVEVQWTIRRSRIASAWPQSMPRGWR